MPISEKILVGIIVCLIVIFALIIAATFIGPPRLEIVVTYNYDSPNSEIYVIVTMPDGKMQSIYLPAARVMRLENGDKLCLLVETQAVFGTKIYTVADNCQ